RVLCDCPGCEGGSEKSSQNVIDAPESHDNPTPAALIPVAHHLDQSRPATRLAQPVQAGKGKQPVRRSTQAHQQVADDNQKQSCAYNSSRTEPVRQGSTGKLANRVEQAVTENDVGQVQMAQPFSALQQGESDAEILPAKIKSRICDP